MKTKKLTNQEVFAAIKEIKDTNDKTRQNLLAAELIEQYTYLYYQLSKAGYNIDKEDLKQQAFIILWRQIDKCRTEMTTKITKKQAPIRKDYVVIGKCYWESDDGIGFRQAKWEKDMAEYEELPFDVLVSMPNYNLLGYFRKTLKRDLIRYINKNISGFETLTESYWDGKRYNERNNKANWVLKQEDTNNNFNEYILVLSERQKQIVELFLEGNTLEEIAKELNITRKTASKIYQAAIKTMRRAI